MEKKIFISQHSCDAILKHAFVANETNKEYSFTDQLKKKSRTMVFENN